MGNDISENRNSAFIEKGIGNSIKGLIKEIQELYLFDEVPWVIGYSGGKDSTAVLQLTWMAINKLPPDKRLKPIHVISTDTLVEQPVVSAWVDASHKQMEKSASDQRLPIIPHKLVPDVKDRYWVNLIGKGYPAPRKLFRWCTSRMKINPSNTFIRQMVRENGETILLLGSRKAESTRRARTLTQHALKQVKEKLSPNASLPNSLVYTPIENWSNDDVWLFLMQYKNPWGFTNKSLLGMYQGATADGECPLVIDSSTPSCGDSRFGCWVCTLVDKDRSMEAMIKNDEEKVWMSPLLELRNELADFAEDKNRRDYRRMSGKIHLFHDSIVRGPYTKETREYWLTRVLEIQKLIAKEGPNDFNNLELISIDDLDEIRRIWLYEKHEFDDSLPTIYEDILGEKYPSIISDDNLLQNEDWHILKEACGNDDSLFELQTKLLDIEREYRGMSRRAGIYSALEKQLVSNQFGGEKEAIEISREEHDRRQLAEKHPTGMKLI